MHGDSLLRAIVPFSARPFNFAKEYRITEEEVSCFFFVVVFLILHTKINIRSTFSQITFIVSQVDTFPKQVSAKQDTFFN